MEELNKCPFCGGKPSLREKKAKSGSILWRVICGTCGCGTWCDENGNGYIDEDGKQIAIEEWNNRP